jgi:hypothetical protein
MIHGRRALRKDRISGIVWSRIPSHVTFTAHENHRRRNMAKVSWNKTWSDKMRKKVKKRNGKNRRSKKK